MSTKALITVYDVIGAATEDGEWVNGYFFAVVKNATARNGRKPSKADLCDPDSPNIRIKASWFGGDFTDFRDAVCRFDGQGMKTKSFKGTPELTIGDKAQVNMETAAPKSAAAPSGQNAAHANAGVPPAQHAPANPSSVDPVTYFHREMKKTALLWAHAYQYAKETESKLKLSLPDLTMQAMISTIFIKADRQGLSDRPPALRACDDKGIPFAFVAATPDPAAAEAAAKAAAEEAAKKAADEARRKHKEQQDDYVPF